MARWTCSIAMLLALTKPLAAGTLLVPVAEHLAHATGGVQLTLHEVPDQGVSWNRVFAADGLVFLVGYRVPPAKGCVVYRLEAANPAKGESLELRSPRVGLLAQGLGALWLEAPENAWNGAKKLWRIDQGTGATTNLPLPRLLSPHELAAGPDSLWLISADNTPVVRLSRIDSHGGDVASRHVVSKTRASVEVVAGPDAAWVHVPSEARVIRIAEDGLTEPTVIAYPPPPGESGCGIKANSIAVTSESVWLLRCGDGALVRVNATTGQVREPMNVGVQLVSVRADEERLMGASAGGRRIHLLDPESGATRAEVLLPNSPRDSSLADGILWVLTTGPTSTARLWQVAFPAAASALPAPAATAKVTLPPAPARHEVLKGLLSVEKHGAVTSEGVRIDAWSAEGNNPGLRLEFVRDGRPWLTTGPQGFWHGTDLYRIDLRPSPTVTRFELPPGPWDMFVPGDGHAWALTRGRNYMQRSRMLRVELGTGGASTTRQRDDDVDDAIIAFGSLWTTQMAHSDLRRFDVRSGERVAVVEIPGGDGGEILATRGALLVMRHEQQEIHVVDPATHSARLLARLGGPVESAWWIPQRHLAEAAGASWAVRASDGALVQLDAANGQVLATLAFPWRVTGVVGEGGQLLALGEDGSYVARIDPATGLVLGTALLPAPHPKVLLSEGVAWASSQTQGDGWRLWRMEFPAAPR